MSENDKISSDFNRLLDALRAERTPPVGADIRRPSSANSVLNDPNELRRLTGASNVFVIGFENARACREALEAALKKEKLSTDDIGSNGKASKIASSIIRKYFPGFERALKEFGAEDVKTLKDQWIDEEDLVKKVEEISKTGRMKDARLYMAFKIIDEGADHETDDSPSAAQIPGTKISILLSPAGMDPFLRQKSIELWGNNFKAVMDAKLPAEQKVLDDYMASAMKDYPELADKLKSVLKKNGYDPDSETHSYRRFFNQEAKGVQNLVYQPGAQERALLQAMRDYFRDIPPKDMGKLFEGEVPFSKDIELPGTPQEWAVLVILHEAEHATGQADMERYIDDIFARNKALFEQLGIENKGASYEIDGTLGLTKAQLKELDADIAAITQGRLLVSEPVIDAFVALRMQTTSHAFMGALLTDDTRGFWDSKTQEETRAGVLRNYDDVIHGHNTGLFLHEFRKTGTMPNYFATNQAHISFYAKVAHQYISEIKEYAKENGFDPLKIRDKIGYDHRAAMDVVRRMQMADPPIFDPHEQVVATAFFETAETLGQAPCESLSDRLGAEIDGDFARFAPDPVKKPVPSATPVPNSP